MQYLLLGGKFVGFRQYSQYSGCRVDSMQFLLGLITLLQGVAGFCFNLARAGDAL